MSDETMEKMSKPIEPDRREPAWETKAIVREHWTPGDGTLYVLTLVRLSSTEYLFVHENARDHGRSVLLQRNAEIEPWDLQEKCGYIEYDARMLCRWLEERGFEVALGRGPDVDYVKRDRGNPLRRCHIAWWI